MTDISKTLATINVLVVDDMETMRSIIKASLSHMGVQKIDTAFDGRDGFKALNTRKYDLIICDWDMPVMTRIELLNKIRSSQAHKHIPFLLLTASTGKSRVLEAVKAGVNDYLAKPFQPTQLEYRVIKLLSKILANKKN